MSARFGLGKKSYPTKMVVVKYFLKPSWRIFMLLKQLSENNHLLKIWNFRRKKFILTVIGFGSGSVRNGARYHTFVVGFFFVLISYSAHISPTLLSSCSPIWVTLFGSKLPYNVVAVFFTCFIILSSNWIFFV